MDKVLSGDDRKGALILHANNFQTSLVRNDGNGKFSMTALPANAQFSTINGMVVDDFDGDGNLDVVMNGNDYGTEVTVGRYDALNGLLLKGDGKNNFFVQSILQSGIFIPGNGKSLVKLRGASGKYLLVAAQNRGPLKIYELKKNIGCIPLETLDVSAAITYKNGQSKRTEVYYGGSFLSQSARFLVIDSNAVNISINNSRGQTREMSLIKSPVHKL
jgi:hypothetical protein